MTVQYSTKRLLHTMLCTESSCGAYRYSLQRISDASRPWCCLIMLNPSTADHMSDDATMRRVYGYAEHWRFANVEVVNLFALRATDPAELARHNDPIGPENDQYILKAADRAALVVAAWGAHGTLQERDRAVLGMLRDGEGAGYDAFLLHCLGLTAGGQPKHPLRLAKSLKPMPFERH